MNCLSFSMNQRIESHLNLSLTMLSPVSMFEFQHEVSLSLHLFFCLRGYIWVQLFGRNFALFSSMYFGHVIRALLTFPDV